MFLCLGLASLLSTGCLVAEAPEYGPPRQTTPVIDMSTVDPSPWTVMLPTRPTQTISFRVQSEDAGEGLTVFLYLDHLSSNYFRKRFVEDWDFPPSGSSAPRPLSIQWDLRDEVTPGCHQLTLFVTHQSNFDDDDSNTYISSSDVASITWWANVDPGEMPTTLVGCPTLNDASDAGVP